MCKYSSIYLTVDAQNSVDGCVDQVSVGETCSDLKELGDLHKWEAKMMKNKFRCIAMVRCDWNIDV
jgi:hypothetical protein